MSKTCRKDAATKLWLENIKGRVHVAHLGIDGRIIPNWCWRNVLKGVDYIQMAHDRVQMLGFVNMANNSSSFIKADEYQLFKEDCGIKEGGYVTSQSFFRVTYFLFQLLLLNTIPGTTIQILTVSIHMISFSIQNCLVD